MRFILTIITLLAIGFSLAQPSTDFSASPLEVCVGENIQFTDLSTSSETITDWTWDFGDGSTSSAQNPTHSYTNAGNYTITLTAVDVNGASPEVKINYITINPLPSPSFDANVVGGCSLPSDVSITNIQPASGVTYSWDFGNGTTSTSGTPANVTYTTENSFDITLTVTDNITGCQNTVVETVDIYNYEADFSYTPTSICAEESITFSDDSSPGSDSWSWDFGDGSTATSQNPTHTYNTPGLYTITFTANNSSNGCSDTKTEQIEVFALPSPSFDFTPSSGCAPLDVTFTNTSPGNGTFEWAFGDGGTYTGQNPPPYTYQNNGSYSVTLIQTNSNGCKDTIKQSNIINISGITADFEADTLLGCEVLAVDFTDLSISPNANDPITEWEWDFGNGSTFTGQNPPTQYFDEGIYDVTLTVSSNGGCTHSVTFDEYITVGIPPNVDFTWNPPMGCAKSIYNFTNTTTISVPFNSNDVNYEWSFGDGGTAALENPSYEYPQDTGYFDVQLIVDFRGCKDTMIHEEAVYIEAPIANFTVNSVFCNPTLPLDVTFNDVAIIGEVTDSAEMIWVWGNGNIDTIKPPNLYNNNPGSMNQTYNSLGNYSIKQVVHNYTTGCSDSITQIIKLSEIDASFAISNDSACVNDIVTFSDDGSNSNHGLIDYSYNIHNDTIINSSAFNYVFDTPGSYDITYTVTSAVGCQDSETFQGFEVLALPDVQFSPSDTAGCSPLTVTFTNNSSNPSGVPLSAFDWTFEDGSTQTTTNLNQTTSYTFINEGTFETELVVSDEFGCVSPTAILQTTITKPTASFDIPAVVCNNESFTATNNSTDYSSSEWFINTSAASTNDDLSTNLSHTASPNNVSFTDSIRLIVTDDNGCKDTLTQEIIVSAPHADFDFVFSGANTNDNGDFVCPPVFADLTDLSNSYGNITDWEWDFGDNKNSSLQNPNNTYVFAGTYSGTLTITDEYGCKDSVVYEDYLTIGGPSGELEWALTNPCKQEYTFTPTALNGATDILWDLGNGDTLHSIDAFTYSYSTAGTYAPTAILINDDDCNVLYALDTIVVDVNLLDAYFEADPTTLNWGEPIYIEDLSTGGFGGIVNWTWDIEGNQFDNNGAPFDYLFDSAGKIPITLTVTDAEGCKDTFQIIVNVNVKFTVPNILTPNGDGVNDVFTIIDNAFKEYNVTILNRWGNVVSESFIKEGNYLWDGLNKSGKECSDGVYYYLIEGNQRDGEPRKEHGFVHLNR